MRKWLVCVMCLTSLVSVAQVRWDGEASDGQWNSAANWSGNAVPTSSDVVLLDNTFVSGSYTVMLPAGNITTQVSSLRITPAVHNTIELILPSTNTADPGLLVTGAGDALILDQDALLRNSSGASSGTGVSILNIFRINDYGRYVHNTARGNASIVSQLSTSAGTEHGEFEFDTPTGSATISLSNRHYGTLILSSAANGGTATYIGSGASPTNVHGHLKLNPGVTFSINMSAAFIVHDSLIQRSGSVFNLQSSSNNNVVLCKGNIEASGTITESGSGLPKLEMNGTSMQTIHAFSMNILNNVEVVINNPSGVSLVSSLTIPYKLHLQNGKVFTGAHELVIKDNATLTGASSSNFIVGAIRKIGDDNFSFPVGEGNIFAQATLLNVAGELATDEYVVRYHRSNPHSVTAVSYQSPIHHISYVEYWSISRATGNSSKRIALKFGAESFVLDPNTILVTNWNGSQWLNQGSFSFTPGAAVNGYITGELTSEVITDPGLYVTIGTTGSNTNNPLPLYFVFMEVESAKDGILLQWEVADTLDASGRFYVKHSTNGTRFDVLDSIPFFRRKNNFRHLRPNNGSNFYSVEYADKTGYRRTSPVKRVEFSFDPIYVYPNPATNYAFVTFYSNESEQVIVSVFDLSLREIYRRTFAVVEGSNQLQIDLRKCAPGLYVLKIGARSYMLVKN